MSVELVTAVSIIVAWCLVAFQVERVKVQSASRRTMARHIVIGAALAIALVAPGHWGKLALAVGVLVLYLLDVQARPLPPPPAGRPAVVVVMQESPAARAVESEHAEGLAKARQRQG